MEHQPEQQRAYLFPLTWISDRAEQEERVNFWGEKEEEERLCFWDDMAEGEQWWNNMVASELGVLDEQQQESPPPTWPDEDDGTGGESRYRCRRGDVQRVRIYLTFSCRAVIDGMHRQAGNAQRGRTREAVHPQGGVEHERQERD